MDVLVAILLAGGILSIGAHLIRRQHGARKEGDGREAALDGEQELAGLEGARPGDVVVSQRTDLIVERVLRLAEGATSWIEHTLRDGEHRYGIVLHPDDPDHALVGRVVDDLELVGPEPPESLDHRGQIYRLERCGQARVQPDDKLEVSAVASALLDHWLYGRPGAERLWLRRRDGEVEVLVGERVPRHLLELIPA